MAIAEVLAVGGAFYVATRPTVKKWWHGLRERRRTYIVALSDEFNVNQIAGLDEFYDYTYTFVAYAKRIISVSSPGLTKRRTKKLFRSNLVGIARASGL